jgi:fructose-1,6-bisphosphatase/inositol monophosphatase family enzyme
MFNGFQKAATLSLAPNLLEWLQQFWSVRSMGGAVDAMVVAQGLADVWIETNAAPWDLAPFKILTEEAGGKFAAFDGRDTIYGGNAYTCTPGLEPSVRELLRAKQ